MTSRVADGLLDLRLRAHVLGEEERLERERVAARPDEAERLVAAQDEAADRGHARVLQRLEQQHVRAALRRRARGREVVGAVEEHRVDLVERHEAGDVDRARVVCELDGLEIRVLDHDELALRDLPALHDLVRPDFAVVHRAPALLADRRPALAMELPERDVGRPRLRRRRERKPDGDVDQAEAE